MLWSGWQASLARSFFYGGRYSSTSCAALRPGKKGRVPHLYRCRGEFTVGCAAGQARGWGSMSRSSGSSAPMRSPAWRRMWLQAAPAAVWRLSSAIPPSSSRQELRRLHASHVSASGCCRLKRVWLAQFTATSGCIWRGAAGIAAAAARLCWHAGAAAVEGEQAAGAGGGDPGGGVGTRRPRPLARHRPCCGACRCRLGLHSLTTQCLPGRHTAFAAWVSLVRGRVRPAHCQVQTALDSAPHTRRR